MPSASSGSSSNWRGYHRGRFPALGDLRQDAARGLAQRDGVIELMPTTDGDGLRLQIRQRPPEEHARRPADRDGLRRARRCRQRLSRAADGDDDPDRAADGGDLGAGGEISRAEGRAHHGDDRQRRAVRVPGAGLQGAAAASIACASTTSIAAASAEGAAQSRRLGFDITVCATGAGGDRGRRDRHHLHGRQAVCDHPHRQHGRRRRPHQRDRRRLPGQDRAARATSCCAPTSSSNIRRRPASRARSSSSPPITR